MSESAYQGFLDGFQGLCRFIKDISLAFESYRSWYQKNKAIIYEYLIAFADFGVWNAAISMMSERQIVFTDDLTYDFAKTIYASTDVEATVLGYYLENGEAQMDALISRCGNSQQIDGFKSLYEQIIVAYRNGHYQLACVGLFSVLDGILTEISFDKSTSFKNRIEIIKNKLVEKIELDIIDRRLWCVYVSLDSFDDSIFGNSSLKKDEPDGLNRHWVIHGRTRKQYTKLDFLKALLFLDAIIFLDDVATKTSLNETEQ